MLLAKWKRVLVTGFAIIRESKQKEHTPGASPTPISVELSHKAVEFIAQSLIHTDV